MDVRITSAGAAVCDRDVFISPESQAAHGQFQDRGPSLGKGKRRLAAGNVCRDVSDVEC
jgi:hypothetical protein